MQLEQDYPFLIAVYLAVGLIAHNANSVTFMPGRRVPFMLTSYGVFASLGAFIAMVMISRCDIAFAAVVFIVALPIILRYFLCRNCSSTYNVTLMYAISIPLFVLLFPCPDIATIVSALAVATAMGRLGCISAGCCEGPRTSCLNFHYWYRDPEQLVNTNNGVTNTYCKPTVVYEAIAQFVIAGLCLRFPQYAPMVFGIGTSLLVFLTEFWRGRVDTRTTAAILLLLPLVCMGKIEGVCVNPKSPRVLEAFLVSVAIAYFLSNDIMMPKGSSGGGDKLNNEDGTDSST